MSAVRFISNFIIGYFAARAFIEERYYIYPKKVEL